MISPRQIPMAMLIDDDEIDQQLYRRAIDESAIVKDYCIFSSATDALTYLRVPDRPCIDVIFLDMNMPGMNGLEFLQTLNVEFDATVARLITMLLTVPLLDEDLSSVQALELGVQFVDKPLSSEDIRDIASCLILDHPAM